MIHEGYREKCFQKSQKSTFISFLARIFWICENFLKVRLEYQFSRLKSCNQIPYIEAKIFQLNTPEKN